MKLEEISFFSSSIEKEEKMEQTRKEAVEVVKKIVECLMEKGLWFQSPVSDNMGICIRTELLKHGSHLCVRNCYSLIVFRLCPPDAEWKGLLWQAAAEAIEVEARSMFGLPADGEFSFQEAAALAEKIDRALRFYDNMWKYAQGNNWTELVRHFNDFVKLAATHAKTFVTVSAATPSLGLQKT